MNIHMNLFLTSYDYDSIGKMSEVIILCNTHIKLYYRFNFFILKSKPLMWSIQHDLYMKVYLDRK